MANLSSALTRREFVRAGAILGSTVLVTLPTGSARWLGRARASTPPAVDRLAVRVVVDGYHDAIARSEKLGAVQVERVGAVIDGEAKMLHSQHGLGLHLESQRGGETRNVLLDFGFTPEAYLGNLGLLRIDPAQLNVEILVSHDGEQYPTGPDHELPRFGKYGGQKPAVRVQANWLVDALRPIDCVERGVRMEHDLTVAVD